MHPQIVNRTSIYQMPHKRIFKTLRPCCVPSKMNGYNAPGLEHMAHAPHIMIFTHIFMKNKFNLCNITSKTSSSPLFKAKQTPTRSTIISNNKYIKKNLSDGFFTMQ